jgi:hypothetical protein
MHGRALAILTLLFALRVLGQALVVFFSVGWLPPTEQWFSGLIRYPILLGIQLVMLAVMVKSHPTSGALEAFSPSRDLAVPDSWSPAAFCTRPVWFCAML